MAALRSVDVPADVSGEVLIVGLWDLVLVGVVLLG
jgi:hypothetical protein